MNPQSFLEQILFSILRIELLNQQGSSYSIGTGFLVKVDMENRPGVSIVLLISNKHVFEGGNRLIVNFHGRNVAKNEPDLGNVYPFRADDFSNAFYQHPNPNIDLACVNVSSLIDQLHSKIFFKFLSIEFFSNFDEPELDVGQKIVFVGYPDNRFDRKNNLPIVRDGIIASHPKVDFDGNEQFIIDAQVFPGSSGSPVFLNIKEAQFNQGKIIMGGGGLPYKFLGVVSATMIRNNKVDFIPAQHIPSTQEVIGLGIVFKATALKDLLQIALSAQGG